MTSGTNYRAVGRISGIIEALVDNEEPQRLVDLAREIDAPPSSVHLLLGELCRVGLVQISQERRYTPGPALISLAFRVVENNQLIGATEPIMTELMEQVGEDVYLVFAHERSVHYAHRVCHERGLRLDISLGPTRDLHSTAAGQLFLAMMSPEEREDTIAKLNWTKHTERTITTPEALLPRLEEVRDHGWAVTDRENHPGVISVAVPILAGGPRPVAALSVSVINNQEPANVEHVIECARAASRRLSLELGGERATAPAR